ncbi:MAG: 4-hydroxybenzoate 3-monooxygenase, partial [Gammaproteobacteria bacterium]
MRTQVAIVGAGPAGLMLARLLELRGIESVVIETKTRHYLEERIRAGVLEQGTTDTLREVGVGERLSRLGLVHEGVQLAAGGRRHRIDFAGLTGKAITVYGQHEVVKDLIAARSSSGAPLYFEVTGTAVHDIGTDTPSVTFRDAQAEPHTLQCDFIAGCDGFHGITRASLPARSLQIYERVYPFGWLGILAEAAPAQDELVYGRHEDGFALFSMRSPDLSRLYLQCDPDDDIANWPDERIWENLHKRLEVDDGFKLNEGPVQHKGITAMRSFVAEPMRHGRLFLAGDAAHIVPPTGAKGLNLAVADVRVLASALDEYYRNASRALLDDYSSICLQRIWKVQRFSWWMTALTHRFPDRSEFDAR